MPVGHQAIGKLRGGHMVEFIAAVAVLDLALGAQELGGDLLQVVMRFPPPRRWPVT